MTWSGSLVPGTVLWLFSVCERRRDRRGSDSIKRQPYVLRFRGERIAHVKSFLDPDEALKAAGLAD